MSILRGLFLVVTVFSVLSGCRAFYTSSSQFTKVSREYNRLVRWQELDTAAALYVEKELRPEYLKRVAAAENVKLVDYRVTGLECDSEKGTADVRVELDYYLIGRNRLKTAVDLQKWVYRDEPGSKGWFLVTPLPEFN